MKKLNTIYFVSLLAAFILLSTTCRDKKPDPITYNFTLQEAKDYLWADTGSYWIYKNTKTGALDTQTCVGFAINKYSTTGGDFNHITINYEKLSRDINSTFNDWWETQNTNSFTAYSEEPSNARVILRRNTDVGLTECFFYPFELGIHAGTGSHLTSYIGMDSTLVLRGKTYFNVVKFNIDKDNIWDDKLGCIRSNNVYYWAKDVGLIKKEMKTCNVSWELIDYKIIR